MLESDHSFPQVRLQDLLWMPIQLNKYLWLFCGNIFLKVHTYVYTDSNYQQLKTNSEDKTKHDYWRECGGKKWTDMH